MANFKGFKQVVLADYLSATTEEKKGYIWFVRELSGDTTTSAAVYFGTRKYADMNADGKEANIITSLGDMVDENGNWLGFIPTEDHEILGAATDATDAFEKIETAVLSIKARIATAEQRLSSAETKIEAAEEAIATKAAQADLDALAGRVTTAETEIDAIKVRVDSAETRMDNIEATIEENERVTASALTNLDSRVTVLEGEVTALTAEMATKADADDLTALAGRVTTAEGNITALTADVALKANAADVYTKNEVYNKEEVDGKIAGAFKFMGQAVRISDDKAKIYVLSGATEVEIAASEENRGHVYQIDDKEYASNGTKWVELGFAIDLSAYAKKDYVDSAITTEESARIAADTAESTARETKDNELYSAITAETAAREAKEAELENDIQELDSALTAEIAARVALGERVTTAEGNIVGLEKRATVSAATFAIADAMVTAMTQGQIIYVNTAEEGESVRTAGAYIKIGDTLKKLDISSGQGDTPLARIEALENKVGTTALPTGETVTSLLMNIVTLTGNDVEE